MSTPIRRSRRVRIAVVGIAVMLFAGPATVGAAKAQVELASPIFGLATAPDGSLLVADAGQGIVAIRNGKMTLTVPLPGVDDVGAIGSGSFFALTGGGGDATSAKLWRVSNGRVALSTDLGAFEARVNPDGGEIDSNPFDLAVLNGGGVLVADAGANAVLVTGPRGFVDWVATLPDELESTANIKVMMLASGKVHSVSTTPTVHVPQFNAASDIAVDDKAKSLKCTGIDASQPVTTSPILEILQARHDVLYARLFNS